MGGTLSGRHMNYTRYYLVLIVLFISSFALVNALIIDPNGEYRESLPHVVAPRDDADVCGSAHMNYFWNDNLAKDTAQPRYTELFFYNNGSFHDNTYNYLGGYVQFGENGDNILYFHYESAQYYSPYNNGTGSMESHQSMCGYWYFEDWKWYCQPVC